MVSQQFPDLFSSGAVCSSGQIEARLSDLGEVDEVSVVPLVERCVAEVSALTGEPGVSYLIGAGGMRVLLDAGLSGGRLQSALARADVAVTTGPRVIGPGLAVLPPLPRMLFWIRKTRTCSPPSMPRTPLT